MIKSFLDAIHNQLENHALFRRLIVIYVCWLTSYLTIRSLDIVEYGVEQQASMLELGGAISAIGIPVSAILAFISKLYWGSK